MTKREVFLMDWIGDAEPCQTAQWHLFEDVDHAFDGGLEILVRLDDRYTIMPVRDFQRMAIRFLNAASSLDDQ